jgi:hypothetical protein
MNKLLDSLSRDFEKISVVEFDEYDVLLSACNESEYSTLIRYKRYILCIDDWNILPDVYHNIISYIQSPSSELKYNIDTTLIKFIIALE